MIVILILKSSPNSRKFSRRETASAAAAGFRRRQGSGPVGRGFDRTGAAPIVEFMKRTGDSLEFSATDPVGYLNCRHLPELERAAAEGRLRRPVVRNPFLDALRERGLSHERNYVERLANAEVVAADEAIPETLEAMKRGAGAIVQGAIRRNGWVGRPDVLKRVDAPSALGRWSYEAVDAKPARETKAGAVLQLCLYSDLLAQVQGVAPECMHISLVGAAAIPRRGIRRVFPHGEARLSRSHGEAGEDAPRWSAAGSAVG